MQTSVLRCNPCIDNTFAHYINVCTTMHIRYSIECVINIIDSLIFAYAFIAGNTMFQSRAEKMLLMVSTSLLFMAIAGFS